MVDTDVSCTVTPADPMFFLKHPGVPGHDDRQTACRRSKANPLSGERSYWRHEWCILAMKRRGVCYTRHSIFAAAAVLLVHRA